MPRKPKNAVPVTLDVPQESIDRLMRLAAHHNVTPGQIVAWAVGRYHFGPLRVGDRVIVKPRADDLGGPSRGVVRAWRQQGGGAALFVALDGAAEPQWMLEATCEPESP